MSEMTKEEKKLRVLSLLKKIRMGQICLNDLSGKDNDIKEEIISKLVADRMINRLRTKDVNRIIRMMPPVVNGKKKKKTVSNAVDYGDLRISVHRSKDGRKTSFKIQGYLERGDLYFPKRNHSFGSKTMTVFYASSSGARNLIVSIINNYEAKVPRVW
jgi:hypothetical protein